MSRIEEIRQRAEKATEGPWEIATSGFHIGREIRPKGMPQISIALCRGILLGQGPANAEFIARAREDVPHLLERVAELEKENKRLQEGIQEIRINNGGFP